MGSYIGSKAGGAKAYNQYSKALTELQTNGKLPTAMPGTIVDTHMDAVRAFNDAYVLTPVLKQFESQQRVTVDTWKGRTVVHVNNLKGTVSQHSAWNGNDEEIEYARKTAIMNQFKRLYGDKALSDEIKKMRR